VHGFRLGADDYITESHWELTELMAARIEASRAAGRGRAT